MSKSMHWTKSTTVNNVIRERDNIVRFLSPIGKNIYPLYINAENPVVNGVFTATATTPNAIANSNLTFNGSLLNVTGGIQTTGTIVPGSYATGQTIKTTMLPASALTLDIFGQVLNKTFATYLYTPASSNSQIIVDFHAKYSVGGDPTGGTDTLTSSINIIQYDFSGTPDTIGVAFQQWVLGTTAGLGTRSGTIFPLTGAYTNNNTVPKIITIKITGGNDGANISSEAGALWLKITEIAR